VTRYFMTIPEAAQLVIQAGSISKGGDLFVLDMGKPVKIIDLAKRMAVLSGLQPTLNSETKLQQGEVAITITGLRPGEKLFEELSYGKNLAGTRHPRINTTAETPIKKEQLNAILAILREAIRDDDYQRLYQVIAEITDGVADVARSSDAFISELNRQPNKIVPISVRKNK